VGATTPGAPVHRLGRGKQDMATADLSQARTLGNPLELVEEILSASDCPFERCNSAELAVFMSGRWAQYRMLLVWQADESVLHISSAVPVKVPDHRRNQSVDLLSRINEQLWLGHFDLGTDTGEPVFRYGIMMRGTAGASVEQVEDLVDMSLAECDRFYPAFQYVLWGGKDPVDAVAATLLDTIGEA
jgi:hypothetical protein